MCYLGTMDLLNVYRLENATSRLENLASSSAARGSVADNDSGHQISPTTTTKVNQIGQLPSAQLAVSYDELIHGCLRSFMELSTNFGGLIYDQVK